MARVHNFSAGPAALPTSVLAEIADEMMDYTKNNILIQSAQAMLDQWKAEGGTEDAFALLAMENTADSGSQATGGLYTGVSSANAWDQNFLDWALDPARQSGDTGLVKNESSSTKGWHIMYFVGWNDPSWMYSVKTTLKSEDMTEWMDSLTAEAEVVQGSGISHIS